MPLHHRSPRRASAWLLGLSALLAAPAISSRDLDRADPDRVAILDAARRADPLDEYSKFVVKDLYKDHDDAYLCALRADAKGDIVGTDEALDVHQNALSRIQGGWLAVPIGGGFADGTDKVDCRVNNKLIQSSQDIRAEIKQEVVEALRDGLDFGKVDPAQLAIFQQFRLWLPDFDIEHDKGARQSTPFSYRASDLELANQACTSGDCRKDNQQAFEQLQALAKDSQVSSLVWSNCQYGRRMQNLTVVAQCVHANAPRHECRPHMSFLADRNDIDRCMAAVSRTCKSLNFASAPDRQAVCGH